MGIPVPARFETQAAVPTTVVVTTGDGQTFDLQMAIVVLGVVDQGITNPLDGLPIFQVATQLVMQVKRHADG